MLQSWGVATTVLALSLLNGAIDFTSAQCSSYSTRFQKDLEGICVCTANDCDTVSNGYLDLTGDQVGVYATSKAGDRLKFTVQTQSAANSVDFVADTSIKYQKMIGFGGAFTDATAVNVYKLSSALQEKVMDAYFGESGIQYSTGRIPIASCDFSESVYSYNPVVDDLAMENFSIDVDRAPNSHKLELIKRALAMSSRDLSIFASSWAPPTWMTVENATEDCHVKGAPGGPYWKALALYYTKFVEAYEKEGIPIWGLTVQNEPVKPILQLRHWQSLRLTAKEERDFIKLDLGPMLKSKFPNIKLISNDDQKPDLIDRLAVVEDPDARKYIDGVGVHWYKNLDFFFFGLGGDFEKLSQFHKAYPDLFILATEACEGSMPDWLGTGAGVKLQDTKNGWYRAENYARDIINDVVNFASGWTDWNLVLDTAGGPNWAGNYVDAPIIVDEISGAEFYKQPMYYYMGHVSKFVPANSVRIELSSRSSKNWDKIDRVAFLTPENRVVVVLCNRRSKSATLVLQTSADTKSAVTVSMAARSIQTVVFPPSQ